MALAEIHARRFRSMTPRLSQAYRRIMRDEDRPLQRGWTTGACATAAAKAACAALLRAIFPIRSRSPCPAAGASAFALAVTELRDGQATAGIVKDAGDDPDVTHGALVKATVRRGAAGIGRHLPARRRRRPGDAARPADRRRRAGDQSGAAQDDRARPSREVAGRGRRHRGRDFGAGRRDHGARRRSTRRLGILDGISILGTTGVVIPYSCSSWIHSIHRGIDVARAMGFDHVAGATGNASEAAVQKFHGLHEVQLIDMGDFVGGMLKYVRDASGRPRDDRRRRRQDDQARARHARRAFQARRGRSRRAGGGRAARPAASGALARARSAAPTRSPRPFAEADRGGRCRSARQIADGAWKTAAAVLDGSGHRARNPGLRPRGRADGAARRSSRLTIPSRPRKRR